MSAIVWVLVGLIGVAVVVFIARPASIFPPAIDQRGNTDTTRLPAPDSNNDQLGVSIANAVAGAFGFASSIFASVNKK